MAHEVVVLAVDSCRELVEDVDIVYCLLTKVTCNDGCYFDLDCVNYELW